MNNAANLPNIFPLVIDFLKSGVFFIQEIFTLFHQKFQEKS